MSEVLFHLVVWSDKTLSMPSEIKQIFLSSVQKRYPELAQTLSEDLISDHLFSPFVLKLPRQVLKQVETSVATIARLRESMIKDAGVQKHATEKGLKNPGHFSTMMSLDFHLNENQQLRLIEINTNASFLILGRELYEARALPLPVANFGPEKWREDLLSELHDAGKNLTKPRVHIVDDQPQEQRLFVEFLVALAWLKSFGWNGEIRDSSEVMKAPVADLIYNRSTDFFLKYSPALQEMNEKSSAVLSPNPFEYFLLADKERLIEWTQPGVLEKLGMSSDDQEFLRKLLPACTTLTMQNADALWADRKHLFFKPKQEYGSKKAFRGASISHKLFNEIINENMLAQEYVPAPEVKFETPEGPQKFKYDLRCHFHGNQLEGVIARLYQGQVTNLKTENGGFTPVVFE